MQAVPKARLSGVVSWGLTALVGVELRLFPLSFGSFFLSGLSCLRLFHRHKCVVMNGQIVI